MAKARAKPSTTVAPSDQRPEDLKPADRIIGAATRLFCREGIHATGIDRILAEAGAAKMTLYNQFGSKEVLVEVVLKREGEAWRDWFRDALARSGDTPAERLLNLFDVLRGWFERQDYFGCAFINAVGEYTKSDDRIRALALEHKMQVLGFLAEEIALAGCRDPEDLLHELALLMDGAIVAALVTRDPGVAAHAARAAKLLIRARLPA